MRHIGLGHNLTTLLMPPRTNPHRRTRSGAHPTYSCAESLQSAAGYNGPITRSRVFRAHPPTTIHSLPLEILSEIFILVLPTDQELDSMPQFYDWEIRTPAFCAVCSSWRSLALATPRLWNRILIHVPRRMNKAQAQRKADDLIQWISRSHSLPLKLYVSGDFTQPPNGKGAEALIISVIKDHAARWESLLFEGSPSSSLLSFDGWYSLQRLYYPYFDPVSCANETIPWANLTHLQIRKFIPCRDTAIIYMKCPKLVYLSILVNPSAIGQNTVPVILEDLVAFYVQISYSQAASFAPSLQTILHQLSLPSLRAISVNGISSGDIEPLLNLFTRSSCTLDRLEMCGAFLTSREYINVLAHSSCNSLTILSIRPALLGCALVDSEVLRRLTLHQNDTVCSHLSSLTIDYCIPTSLLSALLNMAESRFGCAIGQIPHEPALRYLRLHVEYLTENVAEVDKVGRRSGMEFSHTKFMSGDGDHCFTAQFQTQGSGAPPYFGDLFWGARSLRRVSPCVTNS